MTFETVPALSIAGMAIAMLVSFALPIALFIYSKKKLYAKTAPFFIGCGVFVVMVVLLESLAHNLILGSTGTVITGNPLLYALYGGLMAALFEETGRYIAMRRFVKPLDFVPLPSRPFLKGTLTLFSVLISLPAIRSTPFLPKPPAFCTSYT